MSVIVGIKTNNRVILGADKRLSTYQNQFVSDDNDKILVVNNHLALACAGNKAIQTALEMDINNLEIDKVSLFVEDVTDIICNLYKKFKNANAEIILSYPFYAILGGLDKNHNIKLIAISYNYGNLQCSETQTNIMIFPPSDVSMKKCSEIFVRNYYLFTDHVIEKTVKDISELSVVVSESGNKWIYDNRSQQSEKIDFM